MIRVELQNNKGYAWTRHNNIHIKGYAFVENKPVEDVAFAKLFDGLDRDAVLQLAKVLEGFFTLVIEYETGVLALADHMRSFPLFYYHVGQDLILCDSLNQERIQTFSVREKAVKQFIGASYLLGNQTLFQNVFGIEAGCCLWAGQDGILSQENYQTFEYQSNQITDLDMALAQMNRVYEDSFKRMVRYLNGRTAVIPLSGGHDSRLVAYYLKKLGYTNIIAFSYGDPKTPESQLSKQAAKALDIKYYYIPYTRCAIRKAFKKHFQAYMLYAMNGVSVPCLQTWYAIHWLKEQQIVDESCVVCPGYGGILPGHYVNDTFMQPDAVSHEKLLQLLEDEFFSTLPRQDMQLYNEFVQTIKQRDDIKRLPDPMSGRQAAELFEQWIYKEDQPKGIQNANRLYEFYGLKWATPFFEKAQYELWASIDNSLRYKNKAFKEMEKSLFSGAIAHVPFTGSKEKSSVPAAGTSVVQKCIRLADFALHPKKAHYMNVIVPFGTHVYNTVVTRLATPLHYVESQYILYIYKHSK